MKFSRKFVKLATGCYYFKLPLRVVEQCSRKFINYTLTSRSDIQHFVTDNYRFVRCRRSELLLLSFLRCCTCTLHCYSITAINLWNGCCVSLCLLWNIAVHFSRDPQSNLLIRVTEHAWKRTGWKQLFNYRVMVTEFFFIFHIDGLRVHCTIKNKVFVLLRHGAV